ncbi:MAG: hypothetical protein WAV56_01255 [Microgenomates group bacterium]
MARALTEDEIVRLLALPEKDANAWIDKNIPGFLDPIEAKKVLIQRRTYAAENPIPGFDNALVGLGIGAGTAGIAAVRVAELVKGTTTTYEAVLNPTEIRGRLQAALGSEFTVRSTSGGEIVVVGNDRGLTEFCQIRVSANDGKTAVTVGGLDLTEVKQGASNVVSGLLNFGRKAVQGRNVVEGAFDILGGAVQTAGQAGSDLMTANKIADTIEKYGAETERQAAEAVRKAAVEKAEAEAQERKEKNCSFCGTARPLGQSCPNCGASE